jgi:hypothetical protein
MGLSLRPLGYEGNVTRHAILIHAVMYNETLENLPLLLFCFASFCPPVHGQKVDSGQRILFA